MTRAQELQRLRERIIETLQNFPGSDTDNLPLEETISSKVDGFLANWNPDGGFCQSFIFFKALIEHPCQVFINFLNFSKIFFIK